MNEPYLFEKAIGQQMGDLCRLAVGDAKVTQTGEIVTLEDMSGRGTFGVSVEVPYTEGGVSAVEVTRCGKNLFNLPKALNRSDWKGLNFGYFPIIQGVASVPFTFGADVVSTDYAGVLANSAIRFSLRTRSGSYQHQVQLLSNTATIGTKTVTTTTTNLFCLYAYVPSSVEDVHQYVITEVLNDYTKNIQLELGSTATAYEPYNGDTYTITLSADFYGGSIDLETGTVTSMYAADGTELAEPVVTEIDPISIPILAGTNNVWADVGTVTVSHYAADAETFRPALWYPTIYRGLTSARYLIKRASGAIASFSDAIAAPLVGLRVALPWRSEGYQAVEVTRCGKNLASVNNQAGSVNAVFSFDSTNQLFTLNASNNQSLWSFHNFDKPLPVNTQLQFTVIMETGNLLNKNLMFGLYHRSTGTAWASNTLAIPRNTPFASTVYTANFTVTDKQAEQIVAWAYSDQVPQQTTFRLQLESGSTATAYEPYNGDTYTITLPTTIYGGYLDLVTGQLVATHDENGNLLTNQKLYFLDPVNVSALAGVNNIWSDAGDVAVSYRVEQ